MRPTSSLQRRMTPKARLGHGRIGLRGTSEKARLMNHPGSLLSPPMFPVPCTHRQATLSNVHRGSIPASTAPRTTASRARVGSMRRRPLTSLSVPRLPWHRSLGRFLLLRRLLGRLWRRTQHVSHQFHPHLRLWIMVPGPHSCCLICHRAFVIGAAHDTRQDEGRQRAPGCQLALEVSRTFKTRPWGAVRVAHPEFHLGPCASCSSATHSMAT
jgi:hypothetical protein